MYQLRLLLMLLTLWQISLTAVVYQVGSNKPYQTINQVAGYLNPGDTVLVDGGQSYAGDIVLTRPGSWEKPIILQGVKINGQRPKITGSGTAGIHFNTPVTASPGADHYIFAGFEISGSFSTGILHQSDSLTIRDCYLHHLIGHAVLSASINAGSLFVKYTEISDNGSQGNKDQIYAASDEVNHPGSLFRLEHSYIHDAAGGSNLASRAERNEIYYNYFSGACYFQLELLGPDAASGVNSQLKREDSDIGGNLFENRTTAYTSYLDYSPFLIGGDNSGSTDGRFRFVNNTIICGAEAVFRVAYGIETLECYNNIFFNPAAEVKLAKLTEAVWSGGSSIIAGSNNWIKNGALDVPAAFSGTIYGSDPLFVNSISGNYTPHLNSPLLNLGIEPLPEIPGYEFPSGLPIPLYEPPAAKLEPYPTARERLITGNLDIGAYEYRATRIEVSGTINTATTWNVDTVKIVGHLTVADGVELSVAPGCLVQVLPDVDLKVNGSIKACGLPAKKIIFTAAEGKGNWSGITFPANDDNDSSIFKHCFFKNSLATDGDDNIQSDDDNGGVLRAKNGNKISISDCVAEDDIARASGGFIHAVNSEVTIINSLFRNCQSQNGGVLSLDSCMLTMLNCTIINNSAAQNGGAVSINASTGKIVNSLIWANAAGNGSQIHFGTVPAAAPAFYNCNIQGGAAAFSGAAFTGLYANCLNSDPLLINNNGQISSNSPCIDHGTLAYYTMPVPSQDIYNNPRVTQGFIDIGAAEYQPASNLSGTKPTAVTLISSYPNPFNSSTTISYLLPATENINLTICNAKGETVKKIAAGWQSAGMHSARFEATDLASGIYYYCLQAGNSLHFGKVILVK